MTNENVTVDHQLPGWALFWADLEWSAEQARRRWTLETLAADPVVAAMRRLFRAAGTDPTRYRPASEALLRRLLKGEELPEIHPLVDLNNVLSAILAVPCCVMREGTTQGPYVLRAGRVGESYESLRGPFNLEGKPLLVDAHGPCDTPITGNVRVKVEDTTTKATLVAYLPAEELGVERAELELTKMVRLGACAAERISAQTH